MAVSAAGRASQSVASPATNTTEKIAIQGFLRPPPSAIAPRNGLPMRDQDASRGGRVAPKGLALRRVRGDEVGEVRREQERQHQRVVGLRRPIEQRPRHQRAARCGDLHAVHRARRHAVACAIAVVSCTLDPPNETASPVLTQTMAERAPNKRRARLPNPVRQLGRLTAGKTSVCRECNLPINRS